MRKRYLIGLFVAVIAVIGTASGVTFASVAGGGGNATGPGADAAAAAAIEMVGGGTVLEVENADDEGAVWEVEVKKTNGEELEVLLDGDLNQVGIFPNDDSNEGPDDAADDDSSDSIEDTDDIELQE